MSSQKRSIVDETTRCKSLKYNKNNSGPNTDPCGTPDLAWATEDIAPSTTTRLVQFFKKFPIHLRFLPPIPECCSFNKSFRWQTIFNALLKSNMILSTY